MYCVMCHPVLSLPWRATSRLIEAAHFRGHIEFAIVFLQKYIPAVLFGIFFGSPGVYFSLDLQVHGCIFWDFLGKPGVYFGLFSGVPVWVGCFGLFPR